MLTDCMTLFVYGSLMSRAELDRVLGHTYTGSHRPHKLSGYRREWTSTDGEVAYLNVNEDPTSSVTGFLIEVAAADLQRLDEWESGYQRLTIDGFQVYVSPLEHSPRGSFIQRSYLRLVQSVTCEPLPAIPEHLTIDEDE